MMRKWIVILGSAVVILGAGGYAAYHYGMNLAADKISEELEKNPEVMKQIEEEIKKNEKELAQLGGGVSSEEQSGKESGSQKQAAKEQENGESESSSSSAGDNGNTAGKPTDPDTAVKAPAPEKTPPAEQSKPSGGKEFSSRNEAVRFAMSRFSASEMNQVRQMAADGLTADEKAKLKSIAYSKFSAEEIAAVQRAVSN
ncbi:hypothetical protein [Priestia abyssalis]|uniref:hypothetical protein n=1 Tax=Priestia abyssalis TaxID=1221450 RepID=UPI000995996E|nr:hypothetical protein [Priestia abyssalis]